MFEFLSLITLAQVTPAPSAPLFPPPPPPPPVVQPQEILRTQQVRPLPGQLDEVPVFNSNSPEVVQTEGILLSTFPSTGMATPAAHLNYPVNGRFDIFAHHIARGRDANDVRTLYIGVLAYNPRNRPVRIDFLQAASYLSQEAPFRDLPAYVANPLGTVYAGPGSRTMSDVLRGLRQPGWPDHITIPPRSSQMIFNLPIPLRDLDDFLNGKPLPAYLLPAPVVPPTPPVSPSTTSSASPAPTVTPTPPSIPQPPPINGRTPPINGRSALLHLSTDGPVYLASLAMFAPITPSGSERAPTVAEWQTLLRRGRLAGPRDLAPTPPDRPFLNRRFFYGRVAGVARGSQWVAQITDGPEAEYLTIPERGEAISYGLSTLDNGTLGTGQIQSAPMLVRYPDTAYRAHGNYGVYYNLTLPLQNPTSRAQLVTLMIQTPLKENETNGGLRFLQPPDNQVFFRGTVRLRYNDDTGITQTRYLHLVQRRGQEGQPLIRLLMPPGDRRLVQVDYLYPPDSTPPQVLTIQTQNPRAQLLTPETPARPIAPVTPTPPEPPAPSVPAAPPRPVERSTPAAPAAPPTPEEPSQR